MATYPCRLRKHRKSAHLSQRELALLLSLHSQGAISGIEADLKRPGVSAAIACEIVFDAPLQELFPKLRAQIEQDVLAGARQLHARIGSDERRSAATAYLAALINRLGGTNPPL